MMKTLINRSKQSWSKRHLILGIIAAVLLLAAGTSWAAIPERVVVSLSTGTSDPINTTKITLSWKGYEVGDILKRSLDGSTWIDKTTSLTTSGSNAQYIEDNFPNWRMVYFRVENGTSNFKRVNVYPPIENGHANYADDTNQCKVCHITHTAQGKNLMSESSIKELCYTCHGGAGTGSRYNVEKGTVLSSGEYNWTDKRIEDNNPVPTYRRSLAGPFAGGQDVQNWNNLASSSSHDVLNENQEQLAPGGGGNMTLSCISCHNAHASNNNYRMLNDFNNTISVEAYAYYNTTAATVYDFQEVGNYIRSNDTNNYLNDGMNVFCSKCHGDYQVGTGSGSTTEGSVYRHPTDVPLEWEGNPLTTTLPTYIDITDSSKQKIFCGTCHYAHGTTVEGTNLKADETESTVLKRMNYMGVCEDCHKK